MYKFFSYSILLTTPFVLYGINQYKNKVEKEKEEIRQMCKDAINKQIYYINKIKQT
jgi:hypothetical protein